MRNNEARAVPLSRPQDDRRSSRYAGRGCGRRRARARGGPEPRADYGVSSGAPGASCGHQRGRGAAATRCGRGTARSEEHTSELQSHSDLVCRLLLEKKKKKNNTKSTITQTNE